jgi:hypothetical protein
MTVYRDNAAGRLYDILVELQKQPGHSAVPDAWRGVLRAHPEVPLQLERRMLHVLQLPAKIASEIEAISDDSFDPEFALRWHQPVQRALQNSLFSSGQVAQATSQYNDGALASLEHCSYILHRFKGDPVKSDSDLSEISALLDAIQENLAAGAGIDLELRGFLTVHVQAMKQAISDFFIIGPTGLQDKFDQTLGALYRNPRLAAQAQKEAEADDQSTSKKFFEVLTKIALVLTVAQGFLQLGQSVYAGIEHLATAQPAITHIIAPASPEQPIV